MVWTGCAHSPGLGYSFNFRKVLNANFTVHSKMFLNSIISPIPESSTVVSPVRREEWQQSPGISSY